MAFLTPVCSGTLLVLILFGALSTAAPIPETSALPPSLIRPSVEALHRCDTTQASYWAEHLQSRDSELGFLYRMAWMGQKRTNTLRQKQNPDDDSLVVWAREKEIWRDEMGDGSSEPFCKNVPQDLQNLPVGVLRQELRKLNSAKYDLHSATQEVTLRIQRHLLLLGEAIEVKSLSGEGCLTTEVQVLSQLKSGKKLSIRQIKLFEACATKDKTMSARLLIPLADYYLGNRQPERAMGIYRGLAQKMKESEIPLAFWYRVFLASVRSSVPLNVTFRSGFFLLDSEDKKLPLGSIKTYLCEKLGPLNPKSAQDLFEVALGKSTGRERFIPFLISCPLATTLNLYGNIARQKIPASLKTKMFSELLRSSLVRRDKLESQNWTKIIAQWSQQEPIFASKAFWDAVQEKDADPLIRIYQRYGQWRSTDEFRAKARLRTQKENPKLLREELEVIESPQTLFVTGTQSLPALNLPSSDFVDFYRPFLKVAYAKNIR